MKRLIILFFIIFINCLFNESEQRRRNKIECRDSRLLVIAQYNKTVIEKSASNEALLLAVIRSGSQCKKYTDDTQLNYWTR